MSETLYTASGGGNESKGHTDGSCFARAVGTQEAEDFATIDLQVEVVNGKSFSIAFRKIARAQDYLS